MKRKRAVIFLTAGVLCIVGALGLTGYNMWEESRAERTSQEVVAVLQELIPQRQTEQSIDNNTPDSMQDDAPITLPEPTLPQQQAAIPSIEVDSRYYIGVLEIPTLNLVLPIQGGQWDESKLKYTPCLYEGNLYDGMIIAGHNYKAHFHSLSQITVGDEVRFTDVDGNIWNYMVSTTEVIGGYDVEAMKAGNWDLTLFTCTFGGSDRFTVRCVMQMM